MSLFTHIACWRSKALDLFFIACLGFILVMVSSVSSAFANYCLVLEKQLAKEYLTKEPSSQDEVARLTKAFHTAKKTHSINLRRAKAANCYQKNFFFSTTLRATPYCRRTHQKVAKADKRRRHLLRKLKQARQRPNAGARRKQKIINALANNRCGAQYQRAARYNRPIKRNFLEKLFGIQPQQPRQEAPDPAPQTAQNFKFRTYRTLCVRTCDGYYFPVSFSTLPNHFQTDQSVCQSQCAAPAELYSYANPGQSLSKMVSVATGTPYSDLKEAWRYRKELVKGCSCKQKDYDPDLIAGKTKAKKEVKQSTAPVDLIKQQLEKDITETGSLRPSLH